MPGAEPLGRPDGLAGAGPVGQPDELPGDSRTARDSRTGAAVPAVLRRLWELARRGGYWLADYRYAARQHGAWLAAPGIPPGYGSGDAPPVVLIGGVMEPWSLLRPVADRLNAAGHPVHVVLPLAFNMAALPDGAALVHALIAELDLRGVVLVAHSKGGLVGKYAMANDPEGRIDRLVAIATPFGGSSLARLVPLRSIRALRPSDPVIRALGEEAALNSRITSIYPSFDPHVPDGSHLAGATNVGVAAMGHFRVLADPETLDAVVAAAGTITPGGI
jgi:pimeloyl-ACP methyl ester carboxylesterase